jgi:hypothetical protein
MTEAKSAYYYLMEYMVKDATAIETSAALIYEARKATLKYKSSAADSHTVARRATRFLTRIINNISTKYEITVTMGTAALLGDIHNVFTYKRVCRVHHGIPVARQVDLENTAPPAKKSKPNP